MRFLERYLSPEHRTTLSHRPPGLLHLKCRRTNKGDDIFSQEGGPGFTLPFLAPFLFVRRFSKLKIRIMSADIT